jgi:NAD(P)-dependent dehydrogenase (short-subunit alcohol dehydrogenase family)
MTNVLITGANRGLGLALAREYLAEGCNVVTLSRHQSRELDDLACPQLDRHFIDLLDDRALGDVATQLGDRTIDVLINNAGRMAHNSPKRDEASNQGFGGFDRALWHAVFDINLFTPMSMAERFVEHLARSQRGRIVTMTSMLGCMALNTFGGLYAYRASKAGVNAITKSLSIDLAGRGIIAVSIHPGWVRTDMGGPKAPVEVSAAVAGIMQIIDGLRPEDSGKCLAYDGSELPW